MNELEEAERYSIGGLFTLALHSAAAQADAHGAAACASSNCWGEPDEDATLVVREPPQPGATDGEPDPFWGRDLVASGGLLDAVFYQLGLPTFKWAGLKALPSVAPTSDSAAFRSAVRSLIAVLDEELAESMPAINRSGGGSASPKARQVETHDELWEGLLDSSDEDEEFQRDVQWERTLEERQMAAAAAAEREGGATASPEAQQALLEISSPRMRLHDSRRSADYAAFAAQLEELTLEVTLEVTAEEELKKAAAAAAAGTSGGTAAKRPSPAEAGGVSEYDKDESPCSPLPQKSSSGNSLRAERHESPIALAALWELLQCCIGAVSAVEEAAKAAAKEEGQNADLSSHWLLKRQGPPPLIRFYDARARVALGMVSLWLQIPPHKLTTLEVLLGSDKAPAAMRLSRGGAGDANKPGTDRYRYLKVGLAAVGGGALFAVTGGLAAPAIAAGVGSLLGVVPGAGAAAGVVAGFMSTQVGVAAVTTTMATAGAATTGSKMAYRTAEVKDFGFVELKVGPAKEMAGLPAVAEPQVLRDSPETGSPDRGHLLSMPSSRRTPPPPPALGGNNGGMGRRTPSGVSMAKSSRSGSEASLAGEGPESSGWKSWWGKKEIEEDNALLQAPLRPVRAGEGIKLSTLIGISGWISAPEDYTLPWCRLDAPASDKFALVWCVSELQALNSALGGLLAKGAAGQAARLSITHLAGGALVTALGPTVILGAAAGLLIENAWTVALDRADKAGKLLAHVLMSGGAGGRPVTLVSHSMGARLAFSCLLELYRCGARGLVQDVVLLGATVAAQAPERWRMARRAVAGRMVNCYSRNDWLLSVMFWQAAGLAPVEVEGVENVSLSSLVNGHFEYVQRIDEIMECLQVALH